MMKNPPLLPARYPETDLFFADITDVVVKGDISSMEHPIFALTKQPYMQTRKYEHGANWLEIAPSHKGAANIYDKDILIFAISQLMAAKNTGKEYSKQISFTAYDFLIFSNRNTGGKDYEALKDSLERLRGTTLMTNIKRGDEEQWDTFGLIDKARIKRKHKDGRVIEWGLTLSDWLFKAIEENQVLSFNSDYFRLKKPLERRLYEIARKHCGTKKEWSIGVETLQKKCGSTSAKSHFKRMLKTIIEHQHLPDYQVILDDGMVHFYRTGKVGNSDNRIKQPNQDYSAIPPFSPLIMEKAGNICRSKGIDKYVLEAEYRQWITGKEKPSNGYEAAFLGFVKMKVEQAYSY